MSLLLAHALSREGPSAGGWGLHPLLKKAAPARVHAAVATRGFHNARSPRRGTLIAWRPGTSTTGRGAGPFCFPVWKTKSAPAGSTGEPSLTGVPGLEFFGCVARAGSEGEARFTLAAQRGPRSSEQFQCQPATDQR